MTEATDGFVRVPNTLIEHSDMTAHELLVYIVLLKHRNPRTGKCRPGFATIADQSRLSRSTVIRTIDLLEQRGAIKVKRSRDERDRNRANEYDVATFNEQHRDWFATSAKGKRRPRRNLSDGSRRLLAAAARRHAPSGSEVPGTEVLMSGSGSETPPSASEVLGVVAPRHPNKTKKNKTNEETLRSDLPTRRENVKFEVIEDKATEKQLQLLSDLWIHITCTIPPEQQRQQWAELTVEQAQDLIPKYYRNIEGRIGMYEGPEYGTPAYMALTDTGKRWADSGMDPATAFEGAA